MAYVPTTTRQALSSHCFPDPAVTATQHCCRAIVESAVEGASLLELVAWDCSLAEVETLISSEGDEGSDKHKSDASAHYANCDPLGPGTRIASRKDGPKGRARVVRRASEVEGRHTR